MNTRVVAHLFLIHECVQGGDKLLPVTHHLLILDIWTIDELDDRIQDVRNKLISSEIREDIVSQRIDHFNENDDDLINEIN